jgi:SagB-type dehydrogenase family enzyme
MNGPEAFKTYLGTTAETLPGALVPSKLPAVEVLSGAAAPAAPLNFALLGTLLFLSGGVTRVMRTPEGEEVWFRSAMSAGNLHPVEMYVVSEGMGGVYHYDPLGHRLEVVRVLRGAPSAGEGATVVLTGVPLRTCWKYGARGWRHLWWDAGTVLANMLSASDAHGIDAEIVTAFVDSVVAEVVGCDGVDEVPLALVRLGRPRPLLPKTEQLGTPARSLPVSARPLQMPQVAAFQLTGALAEPEVADWERAAPSMAVAAPQRVSSLSPPEQQSGPLASWQDRVEEVILRRGSPRSFGRGRARKSLLTWVLAAAVRRARLDVCPTGSLVGTVVNVHDVEGFEAGCYRFSADQGFQQLAALSNARELSAELCLGQRRAGAASWTGFHFAAVALPGSRVGERGHRAALLEAGIRAGRLSLASCALGGGATGLTFYDRQVRSAFGSVTQPLLATAVGLRSSPPPPSGTPGRPAELRARSTG